MKIGFIGVGNMASAIIKGILQKGVASPGQIFCFSKPDPQYSRFCHETGITPCQNNGEVITQSDIIILSVKPNVIPEILPQLSPMLKSKKPLLVSIAAGTSLGKLQQLSGNIPELPIIRVMPNVNALINAGVAAVCGNADTSEKQIETILELFRSVGTAVKIPEKDFSAFSAIAGCSPAYAYLFIDSIARAAVKNGMPKDQATEIAAQAVLGSAKMLLETAENPWNLIDKVCSPGGTTIAGLVALEDNAFISTVIKGIDAAIAKDRELLKSE